MSPEELRINFMRGIPQLAPPHHHTGILHVNFTCVALHGGCSCAGAGSSVRCFCDSSPGPFQPHPHSQFLFPAHYLE